MRIFRSPRSLARRAATLAAAVTTIGLVGPTAITAHASAVDNCGPSLTMTCAGTFVSENNVAGREIAVASCTAASAASAVATGVYCYLLGADGLGYGGTLDTIWEPGPVATTVANFNVPIQSYSLCIEGGWVGTGGAFNPIQTPVCAAVID